MFNQLEDKISKEHYEELCQKGLNLIQSRSSKNALSCLEQALKLRSDDHKAYLYRGMALHKLGIFEKAVSSYDKALKVNPNCHEAWSNRGYTLYILGRCEEAFVSYHKSLELRPDCLDAQEKRDLFLREYQKTGKDFKYPLASLGLELDPCEAHFHNDAQDDLERCNVEIASYDSEAEAHSHRFTLRQLCFRRSDALLQLKRYKEAVSSYDTSLGILKGKEIDSCAFRGVIPKALYNQGMALHNLQKFKGAIAKFDKALDKGWNYSFPFYARALSLEKLDHIEEAIFSLEKALEISPCYSASWYMKGNLLERMGSSQEAEICFGKALDISRTFGNREIEKLILKHL